MEIQNERRGTAAVAWCQGVSHRFYEDRFRLLPKAVPLVGNQERGELFAVFDGIGSAPKGREAAQLMADVLIRFYSHPQNYPPTHAGLSKLLNEGNQIVHDWGVSEPTGVPLGGCAGTIAWLFGGSLSLFHAGDTEAAVLRARGGKFERLTATHQMPDGALYQYFGIGPVLQMDVDERPVEDADRIIMVTDGITKTLSLERAAAIADEQEEIDIGARSIVQRALSGGATDDATCLIIEVPDM